MKLLRTLALLVLLLIPAAAQAGSATITYVSGSTIYFDAGADHGLREGTVVEVLREGAVVARVKVTTVSAKRASGAPEAGSGELRVGDTVRYPDPPPADASAPDAAGPASPASPARHRFRDAGLRGRAGVRWLLVRDGTGLGQDFSQASLDLRLSGRHVGGASLDFDFDARPRRTYRTRWDGTSDDEASQRVYQARVAWVPGPFRLSAGRQMSPSLGPVSLLDGVVAEVRRPRFGLGLFAGSEPDLDDWGYDASTRDYGLYADWTSALGAKTRYWMNVGALTSTQEGEINRDAVYTSGRLVRGPFHAYLLQQIEYNRGWRREAEGSTWTRGGSYAALRWQGKPSLSFHLGWDSRRNVRLYRDLVTPVTEFDDTYRQGYWGGADWRPRRKWLAAVDGRSSSGGPAGSADAWTARLGMTHRTHLDLEATLRATTYSGPLIEGQLQAVEVSAQLGTRVRLGARGGMRRESGPSAALDSGSITWFGSDLDLLMGRRGYLSLSWDHTTGGDEENDQAFVTTSWRF